MLRFFTATPFSDEKLFNKNMFWTTLISRVLTGSTRKWKQEQMEWIWERESWEMQMCVTLTVLDGTLLLSSCKYSCISIGVVMWCLSALSSNATCNSVVGCTASSMVVTSQAVPLPQFFCMSLWGWHLGLMPQSPPLCYPTAQHFPFYQPFPFYSITITFFHYYSLVESVSSFCNVREILVIWQRIDKEQGIILLVWCMCLGRVVGSYLCMLWWIFKLLPLSLSEIPNFWIDLLTVNVGSSVPIAVMISQTISLVI